MKKCSVCNRSLWLRQYRDKESLFCSRVCLTKNTDGRFCPDCLAETSAESVGVVLTSNLGSTLLLNQGKRCTTCHSIVLRKALLLPLPPFFIPQGRYRALYFEKDKFLSRKLTRRSATMQSPLTGRETVAERQPTIEYDAAFEQEQREKGLLFCARCVQWGAPRLVSSASPILFLYLLLMGMFPGIIYAFACRGRKAVCAKCGGPLQ